MEKNSGQNSGIVWDVFCNGPSLNDVNEDKLESKEEHRIAVNNAIRQEKRLSPSYWAMRDMVALKLNKDHGYDSKLVIPLEWINFFYNQYPEKDHKFFEHECLVLPQTANELMRKVYNVNIDWASLTIFSAIAFAYYHGADVVNCYGVDTEGKYSEKKWKRQRQRMKDFYYIAKKKHEINYYGNIHNYHNFH